jgi:hypothetical protein
VNFLLLFFFLSSFSSLYLDILIIDALFLALVRIGEYGFGIV